MRSKKTRLSAGVALICTFLLITALLGVWGGLSGHGQSTQTEAAPVPSQVRNFTLYVRDTYLKLPNNRQVYAFGYTDDPNGQAKIPGPTFVVNEGDTVNLTLINDKDPTKTQFNKDGDGHTIHLHGLDLPSAMDGDPMTSPMGGPVKEGTRFTYHFVARQPGTYWYHCHESAAEHIQMGMYGAFVILPKGDPHRAYPGTPAFDKQYTFVLSDMDSGLHGQDDANLHQGGDNVNWTQYRPNYFFINGKIWPAIMNDPNSFIHATVGQRILVRLINAGYVTHAIHSHGFHFQVIGTDGRKLAQPYEKDTILLGAAERYDIIFNLNQAGRYMFHDHFEQATTNDGVSMGGMTTFINVDNRDGTNPVPMDQFMRNMGMEDNSGS